MAIYKLKETKEFKNWSYGGGRSNIEWSFSTKPTTKGYISRASDTFYCRESLAHRLYDKITDGDFKDIGTDKLRLLAEIELNKMGRTTQGIPNEDLEKNFEKGMKIGLHIVNTFEQKCKWQRTKMHSVTYATHPEYRIKLLVASARWIKSSHMLSLFTLIFRVAQDTSFHNGPIERAKTANKIIYYLNEWATKSRSNSYDKVHIKRTIKYWLPLMENFKSFYKGLPIKRNFDRNVKGCAGHEGIEYLCLQDTNDTDLLKRFVDIIVPAADKRRKVKRASK
jgi:hypothetical protein